MLIEVNSKTYGEYFFANPHPFLSVPFIELNKGKADKVIRLIDVSRKSAIGFVAGIKNEIVVSPFSAPFGGFHFRHENIYIGEIDNFIIALQAYIKTHGLKGIEITLPPDIYHLTFNAKSANSLTRNGFQPNVPEITNWINLKEFQGAFSQKNSREYYRQAVRNGLTFDMAADLEGKLELYDLICQNRERFGRPMLMSFQDILDTANLWPVDFFKVNSKDGTIAAAAIFYRGHPEICYAAFWGDSEFGRPLRAMDYLVFNLCSYYKRQGYQFIDLGISTEAGKPNEGLLRFKESHEAISSLRYKFVWRVIN